MDKAFFARCVWQEDDIDCLDKIALLPKGMREEFMEYASDAVHDAMCDAGWEALELCLDGFLDENNLDESETDDEEL